MFSRKGPIGGDIGRDIGGAVDAAAARSPAWRNPLPAARLDAARGVKTVDAVATRAEVRAAQSAADMALHAQGLAPAREAASAIVSARMTESGASPFAVARTGAVPHVVESEAIEIDSGGAVKVERSDTRVLMARSACAVFRLAAAGDIDEPGVKAALAFARAGDCVLGAFRVRTMDVDRVRVAHAFGFSGDAGDRAMLARERWDIALAALTRQEFRVLDGVMRHDQSAPDAARAAWPRLKDRKTLQGRGDATLVSACETLAVEYGFETKPKGVCA